MSLRKYWEVALTGIEATNGRVNEPAARTTASTTMRGKIDVVHTGPGTLAGRYLRQFWHPVYVGALLEPGEAKPIRIMGEDLTLYRGEGGAPHLVAHRCAHRRTQLSAGSVEGDDIRCLYHGWKYRPDGQCIEQPAEHEDSFASRVRIPAYPVKEYLGLIFAYIGEGEPPEFARFPDFEDPSVLVHVAEQTYLRRCNYFQAIENIGDAAHVGIAHRTFQGAYNGLLDSPVPYAEETLWGLKLGALRRSGKERWHQFGMPNINHQFAFSVHAGRIEILVWFVPVDDEQHINFGVSRVPVQGEARERYLAKMDETYAKMDTPPTPLGEEILAGRVRLKDIDRERVHTITLEDHVAMAGQGRITNREEETLGKSDRAIVVLRQLWERELKAFAEDRPTTRWVRTPELKPSEWRDTGAAAS